MPLGDPLPSLEPRPQPASDSTPEAHLLVSPASLSGPTLPPRTLLAVTSALASVLACDCPVAPLPGATAGVAVGLGVIRGGATCHQREEEEGERGKLWKICKTAVFHSSDRPSGEGPTESPSPVFEQALIRGFLTPIACVPGCWAGVVPLDGPGRGPEGQAGVVVQPLLQAHGSVWEGAMCT